MKTRLAFGAGALVAVLLFGIWRLGLEGQGGSVPQASTVTLTRVYWCPDAGPEVAEQFSSGLTVDLKPVQFSGDPASVWNDIVAAYPGAGYMVGSERGNTALLAPPGGPLNLFGLVEWVENGIQIKVVGDGKMALTDLQAVADSLQQASSR